MTSEPAGSAALKESVDAPAPAQQPQSVVAEPTTTKLDPALLVSTQALVPAIAASEPTHDADVSEWTPAQRQLLKDTICKGATDDELRLFMYVCQRRRLDPFTKQIHAMKRRVKDGSRWRDVLTFQTGIDAFRLIAQRTGEYEGQMPFEWCGADGVWQSVWLADTAPLAARCGIYRKGFREPVRAVALYSEYVQLVDEYADVVDNATGVFERRKTGKETPNGMWTQRPAGQLAKCAESLGFRIAFPEEMSGLYTDDEMGQADNPSKRPSESDVPTCPICGGGMYDNRGSDRGPPFKCKNVRSCRGARESDGTPLVDPQSRETPPPRASRGSSSSSSDASSTSPTTTSTAAAPAAAPVSSTRTTSPPTTTGESSLDVVTRDTPIDWAPARVAFLNGTTVASLTIPQVEYFGAHLNLVPPRWHKIVNVELMVREDLALHGAGGAP